MRNARRFTAGLALAMAVFATAGCDRLFSKDSKGAVGSAEKRVSAGDFRAAVRLYESALDGTTKSADVHYKLALLYDDKLKSPRDAVHHCDRYLEFAPNGTHAKDAKTLKTENTRKLTGGAGDGSPMSQTEAVRLKEENASLRRQLVEVRAQKAATPIALTGKADKMPPGARTHIVKQGETLATIAARYYKSKSKSSDILDANYNQLGGKTTIRVGQTLIIP